MSYRIKLTWLLLENFYGAPGGKLNMFMLKYIKTKTKQSKMKQTSNALGGVLPP